MQTHWTCLWTVRWNSLICEIVPGWSSLLLNCNWYLMTGQTMTDGWCNGQVTNAIGAENVNKGMFYKNKLLPTNSQGGPLTNRSFSAIARPCENNEWWTLYSSVGGRLCWSWLSIIMAPLITAVVDWSHHSWRAEPSDKFYWWQFWWEIGGMDYLFSTMLTFTDVIID